jgi:hypothetical protein
MPKVHHFLHLYVRLYPKFPSLKDLSGSILSFPSISNCTSVSWRTGTKILSNLFILGHSYICALVLCFLQMNTHNWVPHSTSLPDDHVYSLRKVLHISRIQPRHTNSPILRHIHMCHLPQLLDLLLIQPRE